LQSWREHKIAEFDMFFQERLRELMWKRFDLENKLKCLNDHALVIISKEFWVLSKEHQNLRENEMNTIKRRHMGCSMIAEWAEKQANNHQSNA
jgi:hypothetical protein